MKAPIIYRTMSRYSLDTEALIAQNGKTITIHGRKSRIGTDLWGRASKELLTEARSINEAENQLALRRRALDARLKETQKEVLAAAKAAPKDEPVVHTPIRDISL